jgi:hypothetical protein
LNSPFKASEETLESSLAILTLACYTKFPESGINDKFSYIAWKNSDLSIVSSYLKEGFNKLLLVASAQIGTHTGKIPNPAVSLAKVNYKADVFEAAGALPYLSSASIRECGFDGANGNATEGKPQRFLLTQLSINDRTMSIKDWIIDRGVLYDALVKIGCDKDDVELLAKELEQSRNSENDGPPRLSKFLIWPCGEQDVLITPVHAYAMTVAVHNRFDRYDRAPDINEVKEEDVVPFSRVRREIKNSYYKVGGGSPQNSGLITSVLNGTQRVFKSFPPKLNGKYDDIIRKAVNTGELKLSHVSENHDAVVNFIEALLHDKQNRFQGDKKRRSLDRIIALSLRGWIELWDKFYVYRDNPDEFDVAMISDMKKIEENMHPSLTTLFVEGYRKTSASDRKYITNLIVEHIQKISDIFAADHIVAQIVIIAEKRLAAEF